MADVAGNTNEEEERRRRENEEKDEDDGNNEDEAALMERLMMEQEEHEQRQQVDGDDDDQAAAAIAAAAADGEENNNDNNQNDDMINQQQMMMAAFQQQQQQQLHDVQAAQAQKRIILPPYTQTSFLLALGLIVYAMRSRQQWYLAIVFISSSKWSYVILGNAIIATCVIIFKFIVKVFLSDLRLAEAEGLSDFFRWNITETCLALTMFRSELDVKTGILFLFLILSKCIHWIISERRSHLTMTKEFIILQEDDQDGTNRSFWKKLPVIQKGWLGVVFGLFCLIIIDIVSVAIQAHDIADNGPSVAIFFGFESTILFVSAMSNYLLSFLHFFDGIIHYYHDLYTPPQPDDVDDHDHGVVGGGEETSAATETATAATDADTNTTQEQPTPPTTNEQQQPQESFNYKLSHKLLHLWKDHKATLNFAVEVQAQAARFIFYIIFFGIVLTYYGLPINLFREVYVSFQKLRQRLISFAKYRKLMSNMNKFESVETEQELDDNGRICIICRDGMSLTDSKKLPGCNHIFHKSCLREWLVQQQSCPTCRGDITLMQARLNRERLAAAQQAEQAAADQAAADGAAQGEGQEGAAAEGTTAAASSDGQEQPAATTADASATAVAAAAQGRPDQASTPAPPPLVQERGINVGDGTTSTTPAQQPATAVSTSKTPAITTTASASAKAATATTRSADNNDGNYIFPSLYCVVDDGGACVYSSSDTDNNKSEFNMSRFDRVIPKNTIVLCMDVQRWIVQRSVTPIIMLQLPDGKSWVREQSVQLLQDASSNNKITNNNEKLITYKTISNITTINKSSSS